MCIRDRFISFLSPCVLPLIPGYISYISGTTFDKLAKKNKSVVFFKTIFFSLGFSFVFIILGLSASSLGKFFLSNSDIFRISAGLIILLTLVAIEKNIVKCVFLLLFYSLGLAIPFIISGILINKFFIFSKNFKKYLLMTNRIGGSILLLTGLAILTGQLQILGFFILEYFPFFEKFG